MNYPRQRVILNLLWIEIKNDKKKNIICGCIYRHPNTDSVRYIKFTFSKTDCNKCEVFLMVDFNIDLLQYDSNTISNDFLNSMTTHSFLPYILELLITLQLSLTIYFNVTDFESVSGNLTSLNSDHFIQFMFIEKFHISYKS